MSTHLVGPPLELTKEDIAKGIGWKVKRLAFEDMKSRSGMGIISDTFRNRPDVVRWRHPIYSVTAWGKDAQRFCQSFRPLVEAGGKVLLLGVEMDRCSLLHLAEEQVVLPKEILAQTTIPENLLQKYPREHWSIGYGPAPDFLLVQAEAEKHGLIATTHIGAASARLFEAAPIVALYKRMLDDNPFRLYGIQKH